MSTKSYDLIVFGATGFVGQIIARYLLEPAVKQDDFKWAVAGRSEKKLDQLKTELGEKAGGLSTLVVDAADNAALMEMCRQTKVVISTVGPYALYGEPLINACVETGTDYCDLCGEIQWIYRMLERYQGRAAETGARIVNCCGFDSIPSDLGVYFLQQQALERFGGICTRIKMRVGRVKGSFSGGTIASMITSTKEGLADPAMRRAMEDVYSLCPPDFTLRPRQSSVAAAQHDAEFDSWAGPFVMAMINEHVVHRSHALNALSDPRFNHALIYNEGALTGAGKKGRRKARGLSMGTRFFTWAVTVGPLRWMLARFFLPAPGEGPSPEEQQSGFFHIFHWGETEEGQTVRVQVSGDRDPGYGSTAKMLSQAGICLAKDPALQETPGGFWTPATLFGRHLIERLCEHAGMTFKLLE